jgi:hypothetical protein
VLGRIAGVDGRMVGVRGAVGRAGMAEVDGRTGEVPGSTGLLGGLGRLGVRSRGKPKFAGVGLRSGRSKVVLESGRVGGAAGFGRPSVSASGPRSVGRGGLLLPADVVGRLVAWPSGVIIKLFALGTRPVAGRDPAEAAWTGGTCWAGAGRTAAVAGWLAAGRADAPAGFGRPVVAATRLACKDLATSCAGWMKGVGLAVATAERTAV